MPQPADYSNSLSLNADPELFCEMLSTYENAQKAGNLKYHSFQEMIADVVKLIPDFDSFDVSLMCYPLAITGDIDQAKVFAIIRYYQKWTCFSLDLFSKNYPKYNVQYPDLPESAAPSLSFNATTAKVRISDVQKSKHSPNTSRKIQKAYIKSLGRFYDFLCKRKVVRGSSAYACYEAFTVPSYYNAMKGPMLAVFGILNGGLYDEIADSKPDKNDWYSAIELSLLLHGYDCEQIANLADPATDKDAASLIDEIFPQIVVFSLLIHNLRLFSSQAHLDLLYAENHKSTEQKPSEEDNLRQQVQKLTAQLNALQKENVEQKNTITSLRNRLALSPQKDKSASAENHRHRKELAEKDKQIEQLTKLTVRLETDITQLEKQILSSAEAAIPSKPWLDMKLPDTGVVFAGGHLNMTYKLQASHPKWTFVSDDYFNKLPTNVTTIFCLTGHLSHTVWKKLDRFYQNRDLIQYVTATNIDRLDEEMKYALWTQQQKKNT